MNDKSTVSKEQVKKAVDVVIAVAEAIREVKEIPSGHLYAQLMGIMQFEEYGRVIGILKGAGLVSEAGHVLRWTGPEITA